MATTRTATTHWEGPLLDGGKGVVNLESSGLGTYDVKWPARSEEPGGKTSPEELAAAAHSSCFAMALSLCLGERKTPPQRLDVSATVTLDEVDGKPTVVSSALTVRAQVAGVDAAGFQQAVDEAAAADLLSRLEDFRRASWRQVTTRSTS